MCILGKLECKTGGVIQRKYSDCIIESFIISFNVVCDFGPTSSLDIDISHGQLETEAVQR